MQKTLPLYLGPSVIGSVTLEGDENRLFAVAKTYATIKGICRAYIKSQDGTLLIGVLSPEGSFFSAERTFTKESLLREKISPEDISFAYAIYKESPHTPSPYTWTEIGELPEILSKNKITQTLARHHGVMTDDPISPKALAVPLFTGRPFPRPDVLCLMTPLKINGEFFGVCGISENGEVRKL